MTEQKSNNPVAQPTGVVGAPERIWLLRNNDGSFDDCWQMSTLAGSGDVEYVRATPDSSITEKAARAARRIINNLPYEVAQHVNRQLLTAIITTEFQK